MSFLQYQSHSVVRIKCGGFEMEEAVDRRRAGDDLYVMVMKSTDGLLVASALKTDKDIDEDFIIQTAETAVLLSVTFTFLRNED